MKIRLSVSAGGVTTAFEHAGPSVRVGRNPDCELALDGERSKGVSGYHARIDLASGGALLADTGSTNGTVYNLNPEPIEGAVPLRVGDRFRLGFTGPELTVLELDLRPAPEPPATAAPPSGPAARTNTSRTAAMLSAGVLVAVGLAVALWPGPRKPTEPVKEIVANGAGPEQERTATGRGGTSNEPSPAVSVESKKPAVKSADTDLPSDDVQPLGRYVSVKGAFPSVLLQRRAETFPWAMLRPEQDVLSAHTLMSLPGYLSLVELHSGIRLTLWGSLPEFSATPPVLESRAVLSTPAAGFDADVLLERGRVRLQNRKPSGPARVRLRFQREVWDVELEPDAEAVVELWAEPAPAESAGTAAVRLQQYARGRLRLTSAGDSTDVASGARVVWPGPLRAEQPPAPPDWWAAPFDRGKPAVEDALLSLADWAQALSASRDLVDTVRNQVAENDYPGHRVVGVLFLAALDAAPVLVPLLQGDRRHPEVRGAAQFALQVWLCRSPEHVAALTRALERAGYAREKAALIVRLLQPPARADLSRPETVRDLAGNLAHEDLVVRDLAYRQLYLLVPSAVADSQFDPAAEADRRFQALERLQKRLTEKHSEPKR